jgi:hypothetical protein
VTSQVFLEPSGFSAAVSRSSSSSFFVVIYSLSLVVSDVGARSQGVIAEG